MRAAEVANIVFSVLFSAERICRPAEVDEQLKRWQGSLIPSDAYEMVNHRNKQT